MRQKIQAGTVCRRIWEKGAGAWLLAVLLVCLPVLMIHTSSVYAASGTVYSCTINRCYAHPVTGVIEDPGGEASYTTGQGMVEGVIYHSGIMEVTDSGAYYLTFRVSLVDYISNHSFFVQNVGDSGWSAVTPTVTANGSDSNGTTSDLCIQVPSENCVVRSSMYVTPMGRDVIFYFYPNNYTEGNAIGMTAAMVTESAGSGAAADQTEADGTSQTRADVSNSSDTEAEGSSSTGETGQTGMEGGGQTEADGAAQSNSQEVTPRTIGEAATAAPAVMESTIDQEVEPAAGTSDAELNSAQGLSLSTAANVEAVPESSNGNNSLSVGNLIVTVTVSITISGLILMMAAAVIVCYFRKNWRRWGGYDDEEYEDGDA